MDAARDPLAKPNSVQWDVELRNITGRARALVKNITNAARARALAKSITHAARARGLAKSITHAARARGLWEPHRWILVMWDLKTIHSTHSTMLSLGQW